MNIGKNVIAQLISPISWYEFKKCVDRYKGNHKVKGFTCRQQFMYMLFGQLTGRESIRDIILCLTSHQHHAYHLGIRQIVSVSTLTRANERRNWQIWADFANYLIKEARCLYVDDNNFNLDIANTVYALDSSTIDLCLSVFKWAKFRKNKGAIKLHTMIDVRGNIPVFVHITNGSVNDVNILDKIEFEAGSFYVIDKGYYDFKRLYRIELEKSFFVIRAKTNLAFRRIKSRVVDKTTGLRCDQTIKLTGKLSKTKYLEKLRRIRYVDLETGITYVFLTNNFKIDALLIAKLYKYRWQIELFFKWIKQHLRFKAFWGYSQNAVKTQVWIGVCTYLLLAIAKKRYKTELNLYQIQQVLSIAPFSKTPLNQLLMNGHVEIKKNDPCNQLTLF